MEKLTNYTPGPRGVTMKDGGARLDQGRRDRRSRGRRVATMPGDKPVERDAEDAEVARLKAENADLKKQVASLQSDLDKATKPAK